MHEAIERLRRERELGRALDAGLGCVERGEVETFPDEASLAAHFDRIKLEARRERRGDDHFMAAATSLDDRKLADS